MNPTPNPSVNPGYFQLKVALEVFLHRVPFFRLEDPEKVTWVGGQVRGPRSVPVVFQAD